MQPFETARRFQNMSDTWKPGLRPEIERAEHQDSQELSATKARQGQSGLGVRYVLAISLSAALALMAILYFVYAAP